jgi:hypothetical protein
MRGLHCASTFERRSRHAGESARRGRAAISGRRLRRGSVEYQNALRDSHPDITQSPCGANSQAITRAKAAERQASAGAHDGVKGQRRTLAVRAPLHAIVRRSSLEWPGTCEEPAEGERVKAESE